MREPSHPLEAAILQRWPHREWSSVTVLVACSGGADSTALFLALSRLASVSSTIVAAHFNHGLRGEESDGDEAFVREFAAQLRLRCEVGRAAEDAAGPQPQQLARDEASLRAARYRFFERVAGEVGARWVATAHTADDQAETVLHRLCRGAGPRGLRGIRPSRTLGRDLVLCRPLLGVGREQVLGYLDSRGQVYRHDRSNDAADYTRNRIRREVLPLLERAVHPTAAENIRRAAEQVGELADLVEGLAADAFGRVVSGSGDRCQLNRAVLADLPPVVGRQVLRRLAERQRWPQRDWTADHWRRLLAEVIAAVPPAQRRTSCYPGGVTLHADDSHVMLEILR